MEGAVYIALFCFLIVCACISSFPIFFSILAVVWLYRIWKLEYKKIFILALGIACLFGVRLFVDSNVSREPVDINGPIVATMEVKTLKIDGDFLQATVKDSEGRKIKVQYTLASKSEQDEWKEIDSTPIVCIDGVTKEINQLNNFYGFNYQQFLEKQKIFTIVEADSIEVVANKRNLRAKFYKKVNNKLASFPKNIRIYLKLFILGENELNDELLTAYKSLGMIHLLSISGLHLSFFQKYIKKFLLRCQITHESADNFIITFFFTYCWLINGSTNVFRATGQFITQAIASKIGRPISSLTAWSLTFLVYLFLFPNHVSNVGFQLSFLISFILIISSRYQWVRELSNFKQLLFYSVLCNISSIPILSYHFFEFSSFGILANILLVPIFSVVIFPLIILLLLSSFVLPNKLNILLYISKIIIGIFHQIILAFNQLKNWNYVTGRLPALFYLLLSLLLLKFLLKLENRQLPKISDVLLFIILISYHWWNPMGVVGMIDVGQGDSFFIKEPFKQSVVLIDTGGRMDFTKEEWRRSETSSHLSERTVIPSLKAQGIKEIDHAIITHPDTDHVGELPIIASQLTVKNLYTTVDSLRNKEFLQMIDSIPLEKKYLSQKGQVLPLKNSDLYFLHPEADATSDDANESSLCMVGKIGNKNWLFTGDAGVESEKLWINKYPNLKIDVLKVGHHGSKHSTSSQLLEMYQPKEAWISVGRGNRYNHPTDEVIEQLNNHGVTIYRTDYNGAVYYYYLDLPVANKTIDWIKCKVQ